MNPIDALFRRLRMQKRKAFMPFLTAGDPDLAATPSLIRELIRSGASLLEIGFPYSDPIADGPVVQASYTRALQKRVSLEEIFRTLRQVREFMRPEEREVPLVAMASYALLFRRGPERFIEQALGAGLSGAIVPDLPLEETESLAQLAQTRDFKLVQLITPTTPQERAARIARASTGFIYYVSVTGITGARDQLPVGLVNQLRWLRSQTDLPICVGFGISKPEHVQLLREVADGIIVGSALVRYLEEADKRPLQQILNDIGQLARTLCDALNSAQVSGTG